jgi:hypothetical protein
MFNQTYKRSNMIYRPENSEEKPFRARFLGENSYDAGGPFRDVMENICSEITERFLQPTSNMQSFGDISSYQPKALTSIPDLKRLNLVGKMIGWALRSTLYNLSLDFNLIFWKRICRLTITIEDLKHVD